MALWTDQIEPAEVTVIARRALADIEAQAGTLAEYLPSVGVNDTVVRFTQDGDKLEETAKWRAFDAEPEIGKQAESGRRVTIELPAVSEQIPVSEYQQLVIRNSSDETIQGHIAKTTIEAVSRIARTVERLRGVVLNTGRATVNQDNFKIDDDFGRKAEHNVTAGTLWSDSAVSRLDDLRRWADVYEETNGVRPGSILGSRRAFNALIAGSEFVVAVGNGNNAPTRPAGEAEVQALLSAYGLPEFRFYSRKIGGVNVLPDDKLFLLPQAGATSLTGDVDLGATFWGETLTATVDPNFVPQGAEIPGIVAGVWRNDKPPMIASVLADAIAMPVLTNPNLSLAAKVL